MRDISPELKAEISAGRIARLLKITCTNGTVIGFSDTDIELTVDGLLYTPAPGLQALKLTATADVQVSSQQVTAALVDVPEDDLLGGVYDNAQVEAAWASWANPSAGRVVVFVGNFGDVSWDEVSFSADVMSSTKQLQRTVGWSYTSTCRHKLFGGAEKGRIGFCGLSPSGFSYSGAVTAVGVQKWKFTTNLTVADGLLSAGVLTWTSGNNAGLSVTIKRQVGGVLDLFISSAFTIQPGDTFTVLAGCDKTIDTCKTKFNNVVNFGGFPHIQPDVNFR